MVKIFFTNVMRVIEFISWGVWKTVLIGLFWATIGLGMLIYQAEYFDFVLSFFLGAVIYLVITCSLVIWFHWGIYFRDSDK